MQINEFYYAERIWLDNRNMKINLLKRLSERVKIQRNTLTIVYAT